MHYIATAQTDVGIVKHVNQDSLTIKIADTELGEIVLAVICDGMGGLAQGEVASANVILAFEDWFYNKLGEILANGWTPEDIKGSWYSIVHTCNDQIVRYGRSQSKDIGTTLTAMLFVGKEYYLIHVGDCRAYEITSELACLTTDQTYVAREIALGHMTPEQAKTDSRRNVLLQCIGVSNDVNPDFLHGQVKPHASYLLCSDGFRHEVAPQEIYHYCHADKNPNTEAMNQNIKYLLELNKSRNEKDNISAVLIRTEV